MKKLQLFFTFTLLLSFFALKSTVFAQNEPVMYFCDKIGGNGAVGISDQHPIGYLTVMVKSNYAMGLHEVAIQLDKYNFRTDEFEYYKKFHYTMELDMKIVSFEKNDESDMEFEDPGFYRVFLLDDRDKTVASALIEIIR
jgi:hypothetical protein